VFLGAWSPLVEFEQLSVHNLEKGLLYWEALAPIGERWKEIEVSQVVVGSVSRDEMIQQRVLGKREFSAELSCCWQELKNKIAENSVEGRIAYWDFIGANTYEETVDRALLTSFLVTYGYATLEIDRLEETIFIIPYDKPQTQALTVASKSVPIAVSNEDWQKWKRGIQS